MKRYAMLGWKSRRMGASTLVNHQLNFGSELKSSLMLKDSGRLVPLLGCFLVGG
ncbi:hypothetical protein LINGRAHAP2_LOCUS23849 [Linum grandiflorum]